MVEAISSTILSHACVFEKISYSIIRTINSHNFECKTYNRKYYRSSGSSSFQHLIVEEEKMLYVHLYKSLQIKFYHQLFSMENEYYILFSPQMWTFFSYLTWFQPLYKVERVPGGIGSLHTTLPNSFTLASPPSSFKILTISEKSTNGLIKLKSLKYIRKKLSLFQKT